MKKIISYLAGTNLIVGIVLVNILVALLPAIRLDVSQDKIHSISPASRKIVKELNDVVNIKVYMTEDLPAEVKPVSESLKTMLAEFERINPSKLKVSYFDPSKNSEYKSDAEKLGIRPLQFSSLKSDKFEVQQGYFGLALVFGDKKEVPPIAEDVGNLEYFLVSGIKRLTSKELPPVSLYIDPSIKAETQYLDKILSQNYKLDRVNIVDDSKLSDASQVLMIVGNQVKLSDKGVEKLKNWLASNKGLVVFTDPVAVDNQMQGTAIEDTGLEKVLNEKGVSIKKELVLDESSSIANFRSESGNFMVQYPYWVLIRPENVDRNIPAVSGVGTLMLPWASPIELSGSAKALFTSSQNSFSDTNVQALSPNSNRNFEQAQLKKFTLGAINTDNAKLAVISDTDMIKDQFFVSNQQNMVMALNLIDYFSQDQSLLSIRSKSLNMNPIAPVKDNLKTTIRIINILAPIILLTIIAFGANALRKKRNENWTRELN